MKDTCSVLDEFGLTVSPKTGVRGDYLIERAFAINNDVSNRPSETLLSDGLKP